MRKILLIAALLVFVSCSGEAVRRLVPVAEETPDAGNEITDVENSGKTDDDIVPAEETGDSGEVNDQEEPAVNDETPVAPDETPVTDDEMPEIPDSEEEPVNDEIPETPDEDEDNEPELPDIEYPECGIAFNGSNCSAAYCHTIDDCCEGDVCVATDGCGGNKVCRNAFFRENFDSYVAGNFPPDGSGWTLKYRGAGKQYQIVTSERYVSAENSMHMLGSKSGNLSAIMTAALPQVPDVINVEFMMNAQGDDVSLALCSFERESPGQNWGDMYLKIEFADGKIRYQIPEWKVYDVAPSYEANTWYKLRIKMNQPEKTVSVWVNDELKVENRAFDLDSWSIPNICLASNKNDKKVWFDDIFVWGE